MSLVSIACLTGFFGDAILQVLSRFMGGPTGWGLKPYFQQHGAAESLAIAAGMMALFYILYIDILQIPITAGSWRQTALYLAIYGIVLDYIFRKFNIFPSLAGYYAHLNYFWSAFWGAVPMLIPFIIFTLAR